MRSSLLLGNLMHVRGTPVKNTFVYPVFYLLLDLDELPDLDRRLSLFGVNRAAPIAFHDKDHLGDPGKSVKANLAAFLDKNGFNPPEGRVLLLTLPRLFGYVFNPVSFFYCYDVDDKLVLIVAEVNNTWGERHPYILLPDKAETIKSDGVVTCRAEKVFYVSPFIEMEAHYEFTFSPLGEKVHVHIDEYQNGVKFFTARLWGERAPLTDQKLRNVLIRYPFSTIMVMVRILWQALKLWLWRVPIVKKV
jgi:DUF1365 family protein